MQIILTLGPQTHGPWSALLITGSYQVCLSGILMKGLQCPLQSLTDRGSCGYDLPWVFWAPGIQLPGCQMSSEELAFALQVPEEAAASGSPSEGVPVTSKKVLRDCASWNDSLINHGETPAQLGIGERMFQICT